ncbi:pantoate--beta-alanine ligase [Rummeliibacillus suwonensis]|jgi:pantoate--beta-alanine ligase|uniref:pantoate--beta-alanine ligase n=1 Tax=Rummeliibacillus suwonensis TaxID=1306154 RepID=UPI0011B7C9F3|nr:pantoate--beta-alanine ligase [Rummeliibacillus suwonensis]MBO2534773.1 pantoate--beta-alanine ligase [Rummeliibacillus suwonensis]
MKVVTTIDELQQELEKYRTAKKKIALVPTMGYLHDGHLTLAKTARKDNDIVVMSDFVNPTQFGPNEDYESYPRDLKHDEKIATEAGVDYLFAPSVEEMYPTDGGIRFEAGPASKILCGASRPIHFNGVLQVVSKLFHIVQPTHAYFGQKDAQQLALIKMMVRDFNFPLTICSVPIVREEDGLAKSSRNVFLTAEERKQAPTIQKALQQAQKEFLQSHDKDKAIQIAKTMIESETSGKIDYLELRSYPDLQEIHPETRHFLLATAVYFSNVRLIDNILF